MSKDTTSPWRRRAVGLLLMAHALQIVGAQTIPVDSSETEDRNRNGFIDRIRLLVGSGVDLNGDYSDIRAEVDGYMVRDIAMCEGVVALNVFCILLIENSRYDTDATPMWRITQNGSLGTGTPLQHVETDVDHTAADRAPPLLGYVLTLVGRNELFLRFTEPVLGSGGMRLGLNNVAAMVSNGDIAAWSPVSIELIGSGNAVQEVVLSMNREATFADLYPDPATVTVGEDIEDVIANPIGLDSVDITRVVADTGADEAITMAPTFARNIDRVVSLSEGEDFGIVTNFDGGQFVEPETIIVQVRHHSDITDPSIPALIASIDVPQNEIFDGLWLPSRLPDLVPSGVSQTITITGREDSSGQFFEYILRPSVIDAEGRSVEFVFQEGDFYFVRLSDPDGDDWYRNLAPYRFSVRSVTPQRGSVSILNNVINPLRDESAVVLFTLTDAATVTITVFNLAGDVITVLQRGRLAAGRHSRSWDGTNRQGRTVARGLYFIRIGYDQIDEYRKVLVVK